MRRGVHVLQHTPVTGLVRDGDRVTGVETANGPIAAGVVLSAVGGNVTTIAELGRRAAADPHPPAAGVRHERLRAGASHPIVSDTDLVCYVSQTARGQMLIGAEFDPQPSYSTAVHVRLPAELHGEGLAPAAVPARPAHPAAVDRHLRRVSRLLADHGRHRGRRTSSSPTGWGTWGFKAIPAGGEQMAELIATGRTPPLHRAVRARPLRPRPRDGRPRLDGDPLMLWITVPELRPPARRGVLASAASSRACRTASPTPTARPRLRLDVRQRRGPSTERWFHHAGCRRWLTLRRDTRTDEILDA